MRDALKSLGTFLFGPQAKHVQLKCDYCGHAPDLICARCEPHEAVTGYIGHLISDHWDELVNVHNILTNDDKYGWAPGGSNPVRCDGEHPGEPCTDQQCWQRDPDDTTTGGDSGDQAPTGPRSDRVNSPAPATPDASRPPE